MEGIVRNQSLRQLNTFGIDVAAAGYAPFTNVAGLLQLLEHIPPSQLAMVLGGGSNILFTRPVEGYVLHNRIEGIEVVAQDDACVYVRAGAGVVWHHLVAYAVQQGWGGLENLSLIPGSVGAAPIQNIGAYGVELKDVLHSLEALEIATGQVKTFTAAACAFGYRNSYFKQAGKNKYIITSVTCKLQKQPRINTSYGAIAQELQAMGLAQPTIADVSQAVIRIRQSKLPDPAVTGNAGSFFKNPVIPLHKMEQLRQQHPTLPGYPDAHEKIKVPAAWLIEQCGWKGYRRGDAGVHPKQALVLVNYAHATGQEILQLSQDIADSVLQKFGIALEREVNVW